MSADVHFSNLGLEGKNARRMSDSLVGLISSSESDESNDNNNLKSWLRTALNLSGASGLPNIAESLWRSS